MGVALTIAPAKLLSMSPESNGGWDPDACQDGKKPAGFKSGLQYLRSLRRQDSAKPLGTAYLRYVLTR